MITQNELHKMTAELEVANKRADDAELTAQRLWSVMEIFRVQRDAFYRKALEEIAQYNYAVWKWRDRANEASSKVNDIQDELLATNKRVDGARAVAIEDAKKELLEAIASAPMHFQRVLADAVLRVSALATVPAGHVVVPVDLLLDALSSEEGAEQHGLNVARAILEKARTK